MKVNVKVSWQNQSFMFENIELDNHELPKFETIEEAVVENFYNHFYIDKVIDTLTGKEL